MINIWQKKVVELLAIHFYRGVFYTKVQNIITHEIKLDRSFLKQNFVKILVIHLDHNFKDAGYFFFVFPSNLLKRLS